MPFDSSDLQSIFHKTPCLLIKSQYLSLACVYNRCNAKCDQNNPIHPSLAHPDAVTLQNRTGRKHAYKRAAESIVCVCVWVARVIQRDIQWESEREKTGPFDFSIKAGEGREQRNGPSALSPKQRRAASIHNISISLGAREWDRRLKCLE